MSGTPGSREPITVTATDPATGEAETRTVRPGDYALITVDPCAQQHTEIDFITGTVTIMLKGYRPGRPSA